MLMPILLLLFFINFLILLLVTWNALAWPKPGLPARDCPNTCSALVPARNEQENIGPCLDSVLRQGASVREILVCDDHSDDATAGIVRQYSPKDPRVRLIQAGELPEGWCGKNHACARLAGEAAGSWLLFLDADARLSTEAIDRMMAEAQLRGVTFLSCWPGLILAGFWEKMLMPLLNFVVFTLFPAPLSLRRGDPALGLAHGACILIKRTEYESAGGHRLVHDQIFEDTCLARAWRASGRRGVCLDGQDLVKVRMYESLAGIWHGFQKNFFPAFRRTSSFWLFLVLHLVCFTGPFLIAPFTIGRGMQVWPVWGSVGCVLLMRTVQSWRFGYPIWSVPAHPLAEIMLIVVGLSSWWSCRCGRGVEWKGRIYRARPPAQCTNPLVEPTEPERKS
ncbi:MAG: glycosyltransferase [Rhodospirillales bacterium]|nr:glycosyltransferase [Rhodospirillales bacterium]